MKDEHTLIIELMHGSQSAFKAIYDLYAGRLYGFLFSYLRSRSESEDIVQEVFIKLWQSRETIKQTQSLKSLLFVIGRNLIVTAYRRRINMPAFEDYMAYTNAVADDNGSCTMEYEEFYALVTKTVDALPARQRDIIKLSRQKGLKNKEIAELLGLSEQTVKNQLSLGLKTVKTAIKGVPIVLVELMLHLI